MKKTQNQPTTNTNNALGQQLYQADLQGGPQNGTVFVKPLNFVKY